MDEVMETNIILKYTNYDDLDITTFILQIDKQK